MPFAFAVHTDQGIAAHRFTCVAAQLQLDIYPHGVNIQCFNTSITVYSILIKVAGIAIHQSSIWPVMNLLRLLAFFCALGTVAGHKPGYVRPGSSAAGGGRC